ncbi:ATP-dependent DNA helicase RecQ [Algoriphagus alkaliphilus]|uniref:ATP-dependent DNA helicase RecQ n=1 Tax=Algoriphagus alkaliphilus TaxID=279824 RepID=A0A1G5ZMZ4_9BACT|nr:RecQ family ATP-dependent DNA helicase [Algoriphagus alkaliphilus]SDA96035.1 ATP-dependent DNA helicase RecQ [Algoriphagus alkaliphilus]
MNRQLAEIQLKKLFGFPHFHDLQWQVIDKLLSGMRVLFIEKTGFGKSLCFQFPATQLDGVTIVFSPLIALMRDQVRSMQDKGIRAAAINSNQERDENNNIIEQAQNNELDIVYIAPERMENAEWISASKEMKIAMIVIDEAHCISIWGQSFRPNYRRIVNLVKLLPKTFPVLATTATATPRVEQDIIDQVGSDLVPIRGRLLRSNIGLTVVKVQSQAEKMIWLGKVMDHLPKPGIVYTGTQADTDIFANWLQFLGIKSTAYNGRLDPESRKRIEESFMANEYEVIVSTNALGMGIDKSDIRFIIHTQIPQSPIHYYQEFGRAGRNGEKAHAILLYNPHVDLELPRAFIEGSKPSREKYNRVISAVKSALMGRNEVIKAVNLKQTQVSVILADLVDQGVVNEQVRGSSKKYFYNPQAPDFDFTKFNKLRAAQEQELSKMVEYVNLDSCRMGFLCEYLGDEPAHYCGICDNDRGKKVIVPSDPVFEEKVKTFLENFFPVLEVETSKSNLVNGIAASYYGVSNVGSAIKHCKYGGRGDFPDWLLRQTLRAYRKHFGSETFDLVLYVPPTESGDLVRNFAGKVARTLGFPISDGLVKSRPTEPQKIFESGLSKKDNVAGKFRFEKHEEIKGKSILLIDDIFDSGYTIKEIGQYLTNLGAEKIAPLVIARTVGGDI